MPFRVLGAGVLIRLADADETQAIEYARRGQEFQLRPERSYVLETPERALAAGEVYVVSQAYVDYSEHDTAERWVSAERFGQRVSAIDDATMDLLRLAQDTELDGLIELLGDMGIAGLPVSRWALMSAPRRIELSIELQARLAPLRRR